MGGKPAAHLTGANSCALDGGGPVTGVGSTKTTIGGELAARVGDSGTCPQGGADAIVGGAPCVRIEGGAASRNGDGTAKGGVVGQGSSTVVIGLKGVAG
ncbi:MAG: PAAR domain-containing protein, partial [Sandaracinaceae bacterium]